MAPINEGREKEKKKKENKEKPTRKNVYKLAQRFSRDAGTEQASLEYFLEHDAQVGYGCAKRRL